MPVQKNCAFYCYNDIIPEMKLKGLDYFKLYANKRYTQVAKYYSVPTPSSSFYFAKCFVTHCKFYPFVIGAESILDLIYPSKVPKHLRGVTLIYVQAHM